jgi:exopolysaccharide biosynthesis polyprenyl glycosylphosphotransferase
MQSNFATRKTHSLDFLAEVAGRTRAAASNRSIIAVRLGLVAAMGDALIVATALFSAFWLRFLSGMPEKTPLTHDVFCNYIGYMLFSGASALAILTSLGLYNRELLLHLRQTLISVGKGWAIWSCGLLMLGTVFSFDPSISRVFLACASAFVGVGLLGWRTLFYRVCQHERFASQLRKRVLLLGWNDDAERLARLMTDKPEAPYRLIGYVPSSADSVFSPPANVMRLGKFDELSEILKYSLIDIAILTDHQATREKMIDIANICEREIVQFQLIPSYFEILLAGLHLQNFGGVPLLGVSKLPLNGIGARLVKRTCDIIGAILGLIVSAPLIGLFGLLVVLESPGAVFYRQRRSCRNGANFDIIKIRSMRLDAEINGEVGWSTKEDPRRLRVGSLMRRWNIDELPQFWNVLKGDMSLVGPRPERPELIAGFKHEIPHYNARHTVKPGITGWAQIHGLRGDTDLAERIRHDLFYMENWSLWIDFQCLVFTFFARSNAY